MPRFRRRADPLEESIRAALEVRQPARVDRGARERIAARIGIDVAPTPRRPLWTVPVLAGAAAVVVVLVAVSSQLVDPFVGQRIGPPSNQQPSATDRPQTSASPSSIVAFGSLPTPWRGSPAGGLNPARLAFSFAPALGLPDATQALVGQVTFATPTRQEATSLAARFGFDGPPDEARYGRTVAWTWHDRTRTLVVEGDGSIEYGDPAGLEPPAEPRDNLASAARAWLRQRGLETSRLALEPVVREIGDGRVEVDFNPEPSAEESGSVDYYLMPGTGAFPYAQVTFLPDGVVQQASYREGGVSATSTYPLREARDVVTMLASGDYAVEPDPAAGDASLSGEAVIEMVQLGYQLIPGVDGVAFLVPVYRVSGTIAWEDDTTTGWQATLPAIEAEWVRD